jgi:SAM-dependent methyltransferase
MYITISYDQSEIINSILQLHVKKHRIDCDITYSKGNFYKNTGIEEPKYKFDIDPQTEDTVKADAKNLPLIDNSINCIMFDPPFLATTGKSLKKNNKNNKINKRFGVFPSEFKLHQFYIDVLKEAYRVLKDNGILIFKCQDKVSSGKQYMSHCFIWQEAIKVGYYPRDLFILLAKNRLVANWQEQNQKNARKFHSYFWVFEKSDKAIKYVQSEEKCKKLFKRYRKIFSRINTKVI